MTPLRQRMIRELQLQRKSRKTIEAYVTAVAQLAAYHKRPPDELSVEEVRDFIHWLIVDRKLASSSCNQKLVGIKFFYEHVLRRSIDLCVPLKRSGRLPDPLGRGEVARLLEVIDNPKHRVMMMTTYAAGLRVSELVHLDVTDIRSDRMLLQVRHGKGDRDRYTLLSPRLLEELRDYWLRYRPSSWLFPGKKLDKPLSVSTPQRVFYRAKEKARIRHGHGIHSLRHSFGTHLVEAGVDLFTLQKLMGHKSLSTTAKYVHVTSKHLQRLTSPLDLLRMPQADDLQ